MYGLLIHFLWFGSMFTDIAGYPAILLFWSHPISLLFFKIPFFFATRCLKCREIRLKCVHYLYDYYGQYFLHDISPNVGHNMIPFHQIYPLSKLREHACWLIFITFIISVMVSNFGFGRQQVLCYLSRFLAFKCYFCRVFVMCSINTCMKLSAEHWSHSSWCSYTFLKIWSRCSFPCCPYCREKNLLSVYYMTSCLNLSAQ